MNCTAVRTLGSDQLSDKFHHLLGASEDNSKINANGLGGIGISHSSHRNCA